MKKEFNLSKKRKELIKHLKEINIVEHIPYIFGLIEKQDKEFIKLLKEDFACEDIDEVIDKLAGEKLTQNKQEDGE